jgi:hypothetical protein
MINVLNSSKRFSSKDPAPVIRKFTTRRIIKTTACTKVIAFRKRQRP